MERQMEKAAPEARSVIEDPQVCAGVPTLEGTRIRVSDVVVTYDHHDLSPEEIAGEFPTLRLQDVHAALSYYHSHPRKIRAELQEREEAVDAAD